MARHGINASEVLDVVRTVGGRDAGVVLEGQRRFTLQVRFASHVRDDLMNLNSLPVQSHAGGRVPLGQLATVRVEEGPAQISHERGKRRITVEMNVRGRDLASFVTDAQEALEGSDVVPAGYFTEWGGQFKNLQEASLRLSILVPLALLLIFVLLYFSHGSAKLAGMIYLNVPFAIIGGIAALWLRGMPFSISAGVGFIALFGVSVLNGLVLVSYMKQLSDNGVAPLEAATTGALVRLRAVLTASLVAAFGFVPMALATSAGAEVQKPLATVVIGGLITSTVMTLLVLPAVYAWWNRRPEVVVTLPVVEGGLT
jgi:cobalt-zinc-cadmium resistance protein CzcA